MTLPQIKHISLFRSFGTYLVLSKGGTYGADTQHYIIYKELAPMEPLQNFGCSLRIGRINYIMDKVYSFFERVNLMVGLI